MQALQVLFDTRAGWLALLTMAAMLGIAGYLIGMFVHRSRPSAPGAGEGAPPRDRPR